MSKKKYTLDRKELDDTAKIWAQRIQKILIERKMTQKELSTLSKVSAGTLTNWIKDGKEPKIESLMCVARALDVSMDYLVGFSESSKIEKSYKIGREYFGLSDSAMKHLEQIKCQTAEYKGEISSELISFILANENFWFNLGEFLPIYIANKYEHRMSDFEVGMSQYSMTKSFEKLIDETCVFLYKSKGKTVPLIEPIDKKTEE